MLFKRELLVTQDAQRYYNSMKLLREHNIPFTHRTTFSETRFGYHGKRSFIDKSYLNQKPFYYIFVSKRYFTEAIYLINQL